MDEDERMKQKRTTFIRPARMTGVTFICAFIPVFGNASPQAGSNSPYTEEHEEHTYAVRSRI
jgi:hypothetical protein